MLDVNKQRCFIRCGKNTRHFAAVRPYRKALKLLLVAAVNHRAGALNIVEPVRYHGKQLVVGVLGYSIITVIGLDPEDTLTVLSLVEPEPIGAGELIHFCQARVIIRIVSGRAKHKHLPSKGIGQPAFAPANNMPCFVIGARVGGIGGR